MMDGEAGAGINLRLRKKPIRHRMAYAIKAEIVDRRALRYLLTLQRRCMAAGGSPQTTRRACSRARPRPAKPHRAQRHFSAKWSKYDPDIIRDESQPPVSIHRRRNREQRMPKIDIGSVPLRRGSGYPPPFDEPCAERTRRRLGDAGGLRDFGINLMTLPPGGWSSQRHWHSHEDEFVYLLEGQLVLVEEAGETELQAGECAVFPKGTGNGHHLVNRSAAMAVYLEVGSRNPQDLTTCSDVDLMSSSADGRFVHKDGRPYLPE